MACVVVVVAMVTVVLTIEFGAVAQRWVVAIETKIQLPNTLPIILNCAIGIIN